MSIIIWKISSSSTFKGRRAANHNLVAKQTIQIHSYILRTYNINSSCECLLSGDLSWGATIYKHKIHTFSVWFGIFSICVNFCMGEGSVLAFFIVLLVYFLYGPVCVSCRLSATASATVWFLHSEFSQSVICWRDHVRIFPGKFITYS